MGSFVVEERGLVGVGFIIESKRLWYGDLHTDVIHPHCNFVLILQPPNRAATFCVPEQQFIVVN